MHIRIVNYALSASPKVQAFVDVELDGWLRFNGLNFDRDGGLRSAQLVATRDGQRNYLSAVVVIDQDLRELLASDILAAIHEYLATLPPESRIRPPRPPKLPDPAKPKSITRQMPLAPPNRLLVAKKAKK
jgi:hypothetical protein